MASRNPQSGHLAVAHVHVAVLTSGACLGLLPKCQQKLGQDLHMTRGICIPRIPADFFSADFSINRFFLYNVCADDPHIRGERSWHSHVTVYLVTVIVARPGYAYAIA